MVLSLLRKVHYTGAAGLDAPVAETGPILVNPSSWITSVARTSVLNVVNNAITTGQLEIDDEGTVHAFGTCPSGEKPVRITVRDDYFWVRVFISGSLGFSEAYMLGEVEADQLQATIELFIANQSGLSEVSSIYSRLTAAISSFSNALIGQTRFRARLNAIASYDQSNDLFQAFLSSEMMYSCALWGHEECGADGDLTLGRTSDDLEAAQRRKIHHILQLARVKPGHRILEFGTGWGALAIEAARTYGCVVDTLTLSKEQKSLADERIKQAGVQDRVRVHLLDYRDIPSVFQHAFDAFISIEMLEHVGSKYYSTFFELVDFALKPKNAMVVVSSSTFPESRYSDYQAEDFMRRYMWPNSCLPSPTALINAANTSSKGRLVLDTVENISAHYPRTLRSWDRRLKANLRQDIIARAYPALQDPIAFGVFLRKWEYLFSYAGAGFSKGHITCHVLTFLRGKIHVRKLI
ncbi:cyclopropane-fatty-acyl-phospholipid synthase [Laetiporus sulphureus 93-53]|uniref:Cyclopropane-fatty-acyl-phospholipid synthase n=1 Tax=Laetiporus sulphureus 93-53 TaxID=1314785 RepID=A0A165BXX4_9APHY|nr:cyclopropane-fatty-acyl-phospholipid synthase [Laetiporus sulphureus 93-53]KZT01851.1 cyclopropane-fatty-acyl-phospholipid synthase [Laetiporus sulphureus 93-53]